MINLYFGGFRGPGGDGTSPFYKEEMLMLDHEKFLEEVAGQTGEVMKPLLQAVLEADTPTRQHWVGQDSVLLARARLALTPHEVLTALGRLDFSHQLEIWQWVFWRLGRKEPKLADIRLPNVGPGYWLIIQTPEVLLNQLWIGQRALYPCASAYGDDLESQLDWKFEKRSARRDGAYAVAVRARQEADEEYANRSADWLKEQGVAAITLPERISLEPFFWLISGGRHLDTQSDTYCTSSRVSDGGVPYVYCVDGELRVGWYPPGDASVVLRAREVVSV